MPTGAHEEALKYWEAEAGGQTVPQTVSAEDGLHVFKKAPLKYHLVRSLSVMRPRVLLNSKEVSTWKLTTVLWLHVETGRIEEKSCDETRGEFGHFYDHNLTSVESFRNSESGNLDEFSWTFI